jgi:hypothetical protein
MGLFGRTVIAALTVACVPAPVFAQKEQTTATAQEFLRVTTANVPATFSADNVRNDRSTMSVVGLIENNECRSKTVINRDYEYLDKIYGWTPQKDSYDSYIEWSYVASVTRFDNRVKLQWGAAGGQLWITYPTADLATRAAFAMEFIRAECDPTADLAF